MIMAAKTAKTKKKTKRVTGVLKSREEVDWCVGEYARLAIERDRLTTEMEERIRIVREEYEGRLSDLNEDLEVEFEMAADWAARNPDVFATRKSLDMTHGTICFRTGMPKLKTLRRVTWSGVLMLLTQLKRFDCVRTKTEPDKEKLLADREKLGKSGLAELGVQVVQDETFALEVKREERAEA